MIDLAHDTFDALTRFLWFALNAVKHALRQDRGFRVKASNVSRGTNSVQHRGHAAGP